MNGKGQKASDTIARRLLLLARLPRAPRKTTSSELKSHLEGEGHYVSLRTIERDLEQLEGCFPIVCDRREKPYGWSWARDAEPLAIPGMSVHQAVVLLTAQAHLRSQLPANLYVAFPSIETVLKENFWQSMKMTEGEFRCARASSLKPRLWGS